MPKSVVEASKNAHVMHMKPTSFLPGVLLAASLAGAWAAPLAPKVGDTYEITLTKESARQGTSGSSGTSHDRDTIVERVVGLRVDGLELEYDLPASAKPEDRASEWQFPVRVFKPLAGEAQLLNRPELESRIDNWLKAAKLTRAACGHWIFTWNAFRIECDPQSAIKTVEAFELNSTDLHEGASYREADAQGSGTWVKRTSGATGTVFTVALPVDPETVRRTRAESDVVVGEIMNKPVTIDNALLKRAKETISGTISIALETDSAGNALRRTKVTKLDIKGADGQSETATVTETLERHLIARGK